MSEKIDYSKGVYDAKKLGTGRMFILGVQHMFAMFGATVLVPLLTGLSVSTTLLCAGLGTLLFHLNTNKKVPAFPRYPCIRVPLFLRDRHMLSSPRFCGKYDNNQPPAPYSMPVSPTHPHLQPVSAEPVPDLKSGQNILQ